MVRQGEKKGTEMTEAQRQEFFSLKSEMYLCDPVAFATFVAGGLSLHGSLHQRAERATEHTCQNLEPLDEQMPQEQSST